MAFSSSSNGDMGVLGLPYPNRSSGETGDTITISDPNPRKLLCLAEGDPNAPDPVLSLISRFLAPCLRSCSLNTGLRGPISAEIGFAEEDRAVAVTGSFWMLGSWVAPVSFWTTARKVEGSAWTKVVLVEGGFVGSKDPGTDGERLLLGL